ncbi:MAG: hypothetical protein Q8Q67_03430 [bacterium]|nr:hypothetical protein [bacterium]
MNKIKTKESEKTNDEMWSKLEKDFTVKNMPSFSRFSATSYDGSGNDKSTFSKNHENHDKAKSTGLIIIGSGIVVVGVLFFLAYRFLIVPAMKGSNQVVVQETVASPIVAEVATPVDIIVPETPVIETVATSSEEVAETAVVEIVLPVPADADGDGLSDAAELYLGTNPQSADSDGDGYDDLSEILSGYDPTGPGKLSENRKLALYAPVDGTYALLYPNAWEVNTVSPGATLFSAPDESFIQISYEDAEMRYDDILSWYKTQFSGVGSLTVDRFIDSNFGPGIFSADGYIAYFLGEEGTRIYVLSYIRSGETAPYLEIFRMMAVTLMKK